MGRSARQFQRGQLIRPRLRPEQVGIDIRNRAGDVQNRSKAFILTETPPDYRPILQVIDNQERNAKLGSIFETRVGPGKLLVCGIDLDTDLAKRPAARQLRKSLLDYCASNKFAPTHELPESLLTRLLSEPLVKSAGTVASADSEMPANEARNAIDGNPATLWHTPWGEGATAFPHSITVKLATTAYAQGMHRPSPSGRGGQRPDQSV